MVRLEKAKPPVRVEHEKGGERTRRGGSFYPWTVERRKWS